MQMPRCETKLPDTQPFSIADKTLSWGAAAADTLQALLNPVQTPSCGGSPNYTQPSSLESTQGVSGNLCSNGGVAVPGELEVQVHGSCT